MKTLENGSFQYPDGSPVVSGTLYLTLSTDATVIGTGQIAPQTVTIALDASGDVAGTPSVWGNDELSPSGTVYTAEVVDSNGARVYGPQIWSLVGASPIDLDNLQALLAQDFIVNYPEAVLLNPSQAQTITNFGLTVTDLTVTGTLTASGLGPTLQVNGTPNGDQALLNLKNGSNVSITDDGVGGITFNSNAGANLVAIQNPTTGASSFTGSATSCVIVRIPAGCIGAVGTKLQVSITFDSTSTGNCILSNSVLRRTLPGTTTFTDTVNLTWSSSVTPTFNTTATKTFTSDSVACTLDSSHDTYIILRIDPASPGTVLANTFSVNTITKCSGETTGTAYDTVSAIPNLTTLLSALSAQTELISSIVLGS